MLEEVKEGKEEGDEEKEEGVQEKRVQYVRTSGFVRAVDAKH